MYNMKFYKKQIGKLTRTIMVKPCTRGIIAAITDKSEGQKNCHFDERNFNLCKTYPSFEENKVRALRYYNMIDAEEITEEEYCLLRK